MTLKIVSSDGTERPINAAARAALERVLAENPEGIAILYDTAGSTVGHEVVPSSPALLVGLVVLKHREVLGGEE